MHDVARRVGRYLSNEFGNVRDDEYRHTREFLAECRQILDVGCGTGTFLATAPDRIVGVDLNPDNVAYCRERGLRAEVGNALALPFPDGAFDGAYCSHVMQVFAPDQAATLMRELGRVVRPGGVVVIVTLNWFTRFYRHPENARAYPPDALWRYFGTRGGATSPMYPNMPPFRQESIWLRRPPLVELFSSTRPGLARVAAALNAAQYGAYLRKYWSYDAYAVKLRRLENATA
jgi:SAM-dependent methyltransferase